MKRIFLAIVFVAALVYCTLGQTVKNPVMIPWRSYTPSTCNEKSPAQVLWFNYTTGVLSQCDDGAYSAFAGGGGGGFETGLGTAFSLKLQDDAYVPFAGSLTNAEVLLSNASNDNVQNNAGLITTVNHFFGFSNDLKIVQNGDAKYSVGFNNNFRLSGTITTGNIYGTWNQLNNRGLAGSPTLYGLASDVSVEGNATAAYGMTAAVFKGSAVTATELTGIQAQAANAYTDATNVTAGDFWVRTINAGFSPTTTTSRAVLARFSGVANNTVTTLYGVDIDNWANLGTVTTSAALHIGTSTTVGGTSYGILSDTTSESRFAGAVRVGTGDFNSFVTPNDTTGTILQGDCVNTVTNCIDINQSTNRIFITANTNTGLRFNDIVANRVTLGCVTGTACGTLDIIGNSVSLGTGINGTGSVIVGSSANAITANASTDTLTTSLSTWDWSGVNGVATFKFLRTNIAAATTGDQTINHSNGSVNFAAAATALTVTNSTVTATSIIMATAQTNDSTCSVKNVVPAAGSFVINMTAACTAETRVGFWVMN
jgi:hypothetical protein